MKTKNLNRKEVIVKLINKSLRSPVKFKSFEDQKTMFHYLKSQIVEILLDARTFALSENAAMRKWERKFFKLSSDQLFDVKEGVDDVWCECKL